MEMVLALVERACHEDRRVLAPWLVRETSDESPDPAPGDVSDLLGVAAAARRRLAADLAAVDEGSWLSPVGDRTLATALYDLIQDDTQRLRRMTQRLFEAGIR